MAEPMLTAQEVADYLVVPVATLYAWRHKGEGPKGARIGRHLRFRQADVDRWVQSQMQDA